VPVEVKTGVVAFGLHHSYIAQAHEPALFTVFLYSVADKHRKNDWEYRDFLTDGDACQSIEQLARDLEGEVIGRVIETDWGRRLAGDYRLIFSIITAMNYLTAIGLSATVKHNGEWAAASALNENI
jgi:hypothetical protein